MYGSASDANHGLPFLNDNEIAEAKAINFATAKALKAKFSEGYKGILYGGFMATVNGVKLIEYNARLGDPEAMTVLSLLEQDYIDICLSLANGTLERVDVEFSTPAHPRKSAVTAGYATSHERGCTLTESRV